MGPSPARARGVFPLTCVDEQEVYAELLCLCSHARSEGDEVAPVRAVVGLLEMALQPAVRISLHGCPRVVSASVCYV